ncbi:glycosyltransferase [Lutibacter maritimus]|uniref:Glycosyltransferase 2-like domain-containing protein n=1 Tax=Lutibacter maritimus TaxID=593133 RepID=A0A1I6SNQ1_9FLAO|nr:glycosyltransferase [Lutibacter maritimus]SFS78561.1 hypothetical protein SAMN04488006_0005 [Lutibacter maritimus]
MNKLILIAIVIPYYKFSYFNETLKSLAVQTDKRFKVYIGDDASTESCTNLLHNYKGKIDFEYKKFNTNLGKISLVKHWERCLDLVNDEDYIMILGDDDVLSDNVIEMFYNNLENIKKYSNVVRFSSCNINDKGQIISKIFKNPIIENSVNFFFRERRSSLSEYIFNKNKIKEIGLRDFPLAWCTDILAVLEVSNFGNVYSINESIVFIRISKNSISGGLENNKQKKVAAFKFLNYLITKKHSFFNLTQKNNILDEIERLYLNDKKNIKLFFEISNLLLTKFLFKRYYFFLKSIILKYQNKIAQT